MTTSTHSCSAICRLYVTDDDDTETPLPPPAPDESGDHTPIPPPSPDERDSIETLGSIEAEDRAAREAANIPRGTTAPPAPDAPQPATLDPASEPTATRPLDRWDRIGAWLIQHGPLPALGIITVVIAIIHGRIFLGETAGDDLSFHYAEAARLYDCIRVGDFDFWNPSANGGYASLYYYQAIPQLASAIPAAIFGNHLFWFQLSVVLPLILAPAAAYKGMRLLGATPWQSLAAALCVAFMNGESRWGSGSAGTFNVGLYTQTWSLCAFPLALGYASRWVSHGTHLASAVAWSGFVFLCHPFGGISLAFALLMAWFAIVFIRFTLDPMLRALAPVVDGAGSFGTWLARRWREPPDRGDVLTELWRSALFAVLFIITTAAITVPMFVTDTAGFGGFPHRVSDEVGPGFKTLFKWFTSGAVLDFKPKHLTETRLWILTVSVPVVLLVARARYFRWLWAPSLLYALLLGLGPKLGKLGDDLFPPVRFLGAMQTLLAMAVGAGAILLGTWIWNWVGTKPKFAYGVRTALAAAAAALTVLVAVPGGRALATRVRTFGESDPKREELMLVAHKLSELPQGRKQAGPGAENHWYNMLPYAWNRIPSTLQMGGGGLQASPNYDFLWTMRDYVKNAWIYDAPYLLFQSARAKDKQLPNGVTVFKTPNFEIRRLPSSGLVSPVNVIGVLPPGYRHDEPGHKKALEWVKGDSPMKDEVLAYAGFGGPSDAPKGKTIRSWRQDSPGDDADIVAEVEAEAPTVFMIRESWHPRWHAYVDGEEVAIRRVTPDFPAVDVPAGKHTIELRFERPLWTHLTWLCWPLPAIGAWLFFRVRKKKKTAA